MSRRPILLAIILALAAPLTADAQQVSQDSSLLTVDRIFASDEFDGEYFGNPRWLDDSTYTMLEPAKPPATGRDIVRYDAATGRRTILFPSTSLIPAGATKPLVVESFRISPDGKLVLIYTNSRRVWRQNTRGDYWVLDRASGRLRQLGGKAPPSSLMFAKFSPDSRRVAYVSEHNLYVEDVANGRITPLTTDGSPTMINGTFDWVYEEELDLRDGFRWSPDSRKIAYWQLDASGVRDYLLINDTDSLYSYVKPVQYPKAGEQNSAARVGVVSADGGPTVWMAVPGDPRNNYIARMEWAANSNEIVIQHLNRLQNTNDVMLADVRTGAARTILTERDSAWVDVGDEMRWLNGGAAFTWSSERDGWRHLYQVPRSGGPARLVTPGAFDAAIVAIDTTSGWVYYSASPDNPTQAYLYRSPLRGSARAERITPANEPGSHQYSISPGGRYAFHGWSSFGVPLQADLVRLPSHQRVRTLVDNAELRARLATLKRGPSRFFKVTVGGNTSVDGWMMLPPNFDSTKKYPVLFEVYGEPAGSTVGDQWGGSGYLWDLLLTQHGIIVMSVDNRGTATPRGRAWRKIIYGEVGVAAVADQTVAAKTIGRMSFVDSTRMGVWGWSGGGSTTLGLLFTSPDVYRMGMSVAPVSDKRYYDTIYQERYMGLPATNPEGYRRASALPFAKNLKADLLIVHGSGDDNVHYQNTEAVVNALIAANKPFTMMVYPNRTHCICEGENTTLHLFTMLTRYVDEHLGGRGTTQTR
ncbi:MAG TPA: S9 family peptidase [Gemmatimonadaceae bacterium]|nr:S9 family peptidase [Gemmatimonadaceae bacterium]